MVHKGFTIKTRGEVPEISSDTPGERCSRISTQGDKACEDGREYKTQGGLLLGGDVTVRPETEGPPKKRECSLRFYGRDCIIFILDDNVSLGKRGIHGRDDEKKGVQQIVRVRLLDRGHASGCYAKYLFEIFW